MKSAGQGESSSSGGFCYKGNFVVVGAGMEEWARGVVSGLLQKLAAEGQRWRPVCGLGVRFLVCRSPVRSDLEKLFSSLSLPFLSSQAEVLMSTGEGLWTRSSFQVPAA